MIKRLKLLIRLVIVTNLFFLFLPVSLFPTENIIKLKKQLIDSDTEVWRGDIGDWQLYGNVNYNPSQPLVLDVKPGFTILFNGNAGKTVSLESKEEFGDMRLHVEFMLPKDSNSGIYFMGRYELQIFDSWMKTADYPGIECGGIYQRWDENREPKGYNGHSPLVNASRAPGQWQWFDILFRAPQFDKHGKKTVNACFEKVYFNGFLIHDNVELDGMTRGSIYDQESSAGPLLIQGDHGPVAFRNLWVAPAGINPFFAMDTGVKDKGHQAIRQQVAMLKELGYDGIDHTGCEDLPELLKELDFNGLRLFALYLDACIDDKDQKINTRLPEAINLLKNRAALLWLPLQSKTLPVSSPQGDSQAVALVRQIADLAAAAGLKVALYPHSGYWLERVEDAVRIAKQVNRPNVGITYNLCHWLKVGDEKNLKNRIKMALPYLYVVTINGADHTGTWQELIQPLGMGQYDVTGFLGALRKAGYIGPVGLQGYGIGGDVYENLARSMSSWQTMQREFLKSK